MARHPSLLHSGAPPLLRLDPMVRHRLLLCSSASFLLLLGPMDCRPSSLLSDLILQPTIPHRFLRHSPSSPTRSCTEEVRVRSVIIKNQRWAYMEVIIRGGEYFSEDVMREREPYIHHLFLGRFQDPSGRAMSQPKDSSRRGMSRPGE